MMDSAPQITTTCYKGSKQKTSKHCHDFKTVTIYQLLWLGGFETVEIRFWNTFDEINNLQYVNDIFIVKAIL